MTATTHPAHITELISNVVEVERLLSIHAKITTPGRGRKRDVEILHKSSIVLLVACWESFVEDLAEQSLYFMIDKAKDHSVFPDNILERVASKHQGKKAWDLAGGGWKGALRSNFKEVLARTTGTLNTPRTQQVNELFNKTIGLSRISSSWSWPGNSITKNEKTLDDLITLRGSIAHRVKASTSVQKKHVVTYKDFIGRLSVHCHNNVRQHIISVVGNEPWPEYVFTKHPKH